MYWVIMKATKGGPSYVYGPFSRWSNARLEYDRRVDLYEGTDDYIIQLTKAEDQPCTASR